MKPLRELKRDPRLKITGQNQIMLHFGYHTYEGVIKCKQFSGTVEFGYDEGGLMEHVSVNPIEDKTPSWETMCLIKDMFFYPEEDAIQYHPKASNYFHGFDGTQHCLHLWRPMKGDWKVLNNPEKWG